MCVQYVYVCVFTCVRSHGRNILGGHTDSSIDVSDPISERFYKDVWMTTAARNATIYEKVRKMTP